MIKWIAELFRCKFYDDKEEGGSFTFYSGDYISDIYHIIKIEGEDVTYLKTWYGYQLGSPVTVSKRKFKLLVVGGEYHGRDYLYAWRK
ncbi:hypothetical protein NVP1084O_090 [Vibrio phage 1.084.O._10N.261.49.F5]|nr:hypothetical protein NVP1084O_090 [Vibrio phage 1.084.O._10N.261.49.F5]